MAVAEFALDDGREFGYCVMYMDPDLFDKLQQNAQLQQAIRTNDHLKKIDQNKAVDDAMPKCPFCGGGVAEGFAKCRHCASDLKWSGGLPFKPGMSEKDMLWIANKHWAKVQAAAKAEKEAESTAALIWFIIIIGVVIFVIFTSLD